MGVSLERVQFKFASIIGELCSEPVVLSQFAVWLDLRLAEYKSKGAISLDCSGEKPDPSWLKGLRIAAAGPMSAAGAKRVLGSRIAPRSTGFSRGGIHSRSSAFHRRNLNSHSKLSHNLPERSQHDDSDRLSGSENTDNLLDSGSQDNDVVVVVKEEPEGSSVYPVSLHQHTGDEAETRKRSATDSFSGDHETDSSPYKIPKNPNEDSSLNQSLMSVLGTSLDDDQGADLSTAGNESLQNQMDYSVNLQDQKGNSTGYEWGNNSADYSVNVSSSSTYSTNQPSTSSATLTSNTTESFPDSEQSSQNVLGDQLSAWNTCAPSDRQFRASTSSNSERPQQLEARQTLKIRTGLVGKSKSTLTHARSAVTSFHRWLFQLYQDRRKINQIPPEELDTYLAEYFQNVQKPSGGNYTFDSFRLLRPNLDNYLQAVDYPCSIIWSPQFVRSKEAFNIRKDQLKRKREQEKELKMTSLETVPRMTCLETVPRMTSLETVPRMTSLETVPSMTSLETVPSHVESPDISLGGP